jgi:hypothetical protein
VFAYGIFACGPHRIGAVRSSLLQASTEMGSLLELDSAFQVLLEAPLQDLAGRAPEQQVRPHMDTAGCGRTCMCARGAGLFEVSPGADGGGLGLLMPCPCGVACPGSVCAYMRMHAEAAVVQGICIHALWDLGAAAL